jgi:glycosyltransferase involved in cell wall biosynthesis
VATRAARAVGAAAGFDSEDLHSEELSPIPAHGAARSLVAAVERRHLPACTYVTASAEGIARAMAARYGIGRPTVILNTFPLADRPIVPRSGREHGRGGGGPSLYWYSQVIGAGRGLDDALEALGHLDERIVLHLRGTLDPAFARVLRRRVAALGIGHRVHLLPLVPPPALVAAAAEHDIGLALERAQPMNRDLCVSNKLCTYLVAGLAVVATDTHGQRAILADAPDAGLLYPPGDARALAAAVRALVDAPGALDRAKLASRAAADRRYAWDYDAPRLVAYL